MVIDTCNLKAIAGSDRQCDTFEREDSYIHPILSPVHVSKLIGESIDCVACRKPRNREKYKRHLLFHVKNKELSEDSVNDILFECRSIRKDTKPLNVNKPRIGYKCFFTSKSNQQCGHVVMDLKRHLLIAHKVEISSGEFEDLIEKGVDSGYLERAVGERIELNEENNVINPSKRQRKLVHVTDKSGDNTFDTIENFSLHDLLNESTPTSTVSHKSLDAISDNLPFRKKFTIPICTTSQSLSNMKYYHKPIPFQPESLHEENSSSEIKT